MYESLTLNGHSMLRRYISR